MELIGIILFIQNHQYILQKHQISHLIKMKDKLNYKIIIKNHLKNFKISKLKIRKLI